MAEPDFIPDDSDFIPDETGMPAAVASAPPPLPTSSVSVPPSGIAQSLRDFESDLRYGGGTTAAGRVLQYLGAQGINQGAQARAGEFVASTPLGLTQMAQGVAEKSPWRFAKGALTASQIPSSFVAPPVSNAVPNATRAADLIATASAVNPKSTISMTERFMQAVQESLLQKQAGTYTPPVVNKLLRRLTTGDALTYEEARRYLVNLAAKMSPDQAAKMTDNAYRVLANVKHALAESVQANRAAEGVGPQYAQGINEFRQASRVGEASDVIWKWLGRIAGGAAGYQGLKWMRR